MRENPPSTETRLLTLAGLFLLLYSISLTLSPAVRTRTWSADLRWDHWIGLAVWGACVFIANHQTRRQTPKHDPYLLPVVALLSGWGMLTVWRLAPAFGLRQTLWLALSFLVFILGLQLPKDLGFLRRYKYLWLTGGLLLTATTLVFGINPANTGPEQWLGCCGIYLQPSEPLKLLLIAYLAAYLADQSNLYFKLPLIRLLAPTLVMTGVALLLLVVQRDLGAASIFLIIYASMIYLGTGHQKLVFLILAGVVAIGIAGYARFDLVRLRVDSWLNPWTDPTGRSYQVVQSLIAVAAGEIFGRGPGVGNPSLVPLAHSDFIFTAIAEENGLLGVIALLGLIALMLNRGLEIALRAPDNYRRFLAAGLTAHLAAQSLLIIGGNLRLLPLTGVTLPFLSYGGSSLMASFISLLLLTLVSSVPRESADVILSSPDPAPTLGINNAILSGLGITALVAGWWMVVRGPDLLTRTDNSRQAIADRFVPRGVFLDQNGTSLVFNRGEIGSYTREYLEPSLASVIGYSNPTFGQAGLEASLDPYLRGLEGQTWEKIWFDQFIYGQHPPGLDIRLSIDLELQRKAGAYMAGQTGAVVLLNAQSGEILALISTPTFDPNQLETTWENLLSDPRAPLLNRATQGAYPPGTILSPLLLAQTANRGGLPVFSVPENPTSGEMACAFPPLSDTWGSVIQAGCPAAVTALGNRLGANPLLTLLTTLKLDTPPAIRLPASNTSLPIEMDDPGLAALGEDLTISPLQMALAAATLSNQGTLPAPRLALAFEGPDNGWTLLPPLGGAEAVFSRNAVNQAANALVSPELPIWESLALLTTEDEGTGNEDKAFTWYAGGTLPDWIGVPVVAVVLLENGDVALAKEIGQGVLRLVVSGD